MNKSIKRQMITCFIGVILSMVFVSAIANFFFLEKYYTNNKKQDLLYMKSQIERVLYEDLLNDESVRLFLQGILEKGNISFLIQDPNGDIISTNQDQEWLQYQLISYQVDRNPNKIELIELGDNYEILTSLDPRNDLEYIEMWGLLTTGEYYILRSPMESIKESADIATRFLLYVAMFVITFSTIFILYFSRRITAPIFRLAELSKRMANLEFDVKYEEESYDEIDILGDSFNVMAECLESSISELKLVNNELLLDIEKKDQVESMRSDFLANVSHELKTPIALIRGYAEGLKENIMDDVSSKEFYCEVIMDEAEKMNQLVKNLLELNQLEFGADTMIMERFDLIELLNGVIQSLDIVMKQKEIILKIESNKQVYVWGDQFKVEHVLRNYLMNALNHVNEYKIIGIKIIEEKKVRIAVFNTGEKIPLEDIDHIWDKFYKVDKARTREYGGNGIGLSVVKAIMTSIHQNFGVKNYSNGVEFWFELDKK